MSFQNSLGRKENLGQLSQVKEVPKGPPKGAETSLLANYQNDQGTKEKSLLANYQNAQGTETRSLLANY